MIKVLIVEDSPVVRDFLTHILRADPGLQVIGTASDGLAGCEAAATLRPDIVTMDIHMPRMDGFEATRRIMETAPVPIVIVSGSLQADEVATTFRALDAGALAVLPRPTGIGHAGHDAAARELIRTVKLMAEVRVVRRWPEARTVGTQADMTTAFTAGPTAKAIRLVAIGASTGGPPVIGTILRGLPPGLAAPVMVVQHMVPEFLPGFADWLRQTTGHDVRLAVDGDTLQAGRVIIAPGGCHAGPGPGSRIVLSHDPPLNGHRPSVSHLFRATAETFRNEAIGVLLTGMGADGAAELRLMRDKGAVTFAQNEASCAVFGMPFEAIRQQAVSCILPPERIAAAILETIDQARQKNGSKGVCP